MTTISHCTGFLAKIGVLKNLLCVSNDNDSMPRLSAVPWSLPKRPWIVRTESNVRRETRKRPDPPCVMCEGMGRVNCSHCRGRGFFPLPSTHSLRMNILKCRVCYINGQKVTCTIFQSYKPLYSRSGPG